MSDFAAPKGFEDLWRPVARPKQVADRPVRSPGGAGSPRARLARIAARVPEVMVKITGKTRDAGHLKAHLHYISRDGDLPLEGRDGERLTRLADIREVGDDWAADDLRKREDASLSVSIMLSMPAETSAIAVRDAARAFAQQTFAENHDYVFALHTDVDHPHVHLSVRSLGENGRRLNPRKADLEQWRQTFARALRTRGVEAEATPRRARGIVRKAEAMPVRKQRERYEAGNGAIPRVVRSAYGEAVAIARGDLKVGRPWEGPIRQRQTTVRKAYLDAAQMLGRSGSAEDKALASQLRTFVSTMPPVATRRNELVQAVAATLRGRAAAERNVEIEREEPPRQPGRGDRNRR